MQQLEMLHDTPEEALIAVLKGVYGKGWSKKAAADMWPTDDPLDKCKYLEKALNAERAEKLGLNEILHILRLGRDKNIHSGFAFFADECNYEWLTREPEDELAELQREFNQSVARLEKLSDRITKVQVRAVS